jgi:hypothetical protein
MCQQGRPSSLAFSTHLNIIPVSRESFKSNKNVFATNECKVIQHIIDAEHQEDIFPNKGVQSVLNNQRRTCTHHSSFSPAKQTTPGGVQLLNYLGLA